MRLGSGPLQSSVRTQLKALVGFQFQDFVVLFQFKKHGLGGFVDMRPVKDDGCDGIILGDGCVIACYAPEKYRKADYVRKVKSDHGKYIEKYCNDYPRWRLYVNHDPTPDDLKLAKGLGDHVDAPWGVERLLEAITELPWGAQIVLYRQLGVDEDLIGRDYIRSILDDQLKELRTQSSVPSKDLAPNIPGKINLNIPEQYRQEFERHLQATVASQLDVREILNAFDEREIEKVKSKVIRDFGSTFADGDFLNRYRRMQQRYNDKYNPADDDDLAHHIDAILGYMFCMCLIGDEPKKGDDHGVATS